jgi:hypothetical protein
MMSLEELTARLLKLETEVADIHAKQQSRSNEHAGIWFERFSGRMAGDEGFVEMVRAGKALRDEERIIYQLEDE